MLLVAGNILCNIVCETLGVTHLTEDSAVRRDDAFDSVHGAVRVECNVHSGVAAEVNVLSSHLTVRDKLLYYALRSYEAALAMGYRNIVDIADVAAAEPTGTCWCRYESG